MFMTIEIFNPKTMRYDRFHLMDDVYGREIACPAILYPPREYPGYPDYFGGTRGL